MVAIVGRPNVGKSTLMNRMLGRRVAIVEEKPGVTRDRKEELAEWSGREFIVVDTGGWIGGGDALDEKVSRQSEAAIDTADVVLFVVDATVGVVADDEQVARLLRRIDKPVIVVANKVDDNTHDHLVWELMGLGMGEPYGVSALHGRGTGDLLDRLVELLPDTGNEGAQSSGDADDGATSIALVGRPNVGKSTLFNRLIGEERSVVHDMPGTTRDSVDTVVETEFGALRFIDTAGMRRKSRIDEDTEYFSMVRALKSVDKADVALLVIDSTEGITHQDQRLAERIDGSGCPIIVVLNKWELLDAEARKDVIYHTGRMLHFLGEAPVLKVSALTGKGVHRLLPVLADAISQYETRIPTGRLNDLVRRAQQAQPGPHGARILYATQGATDPPTFTLFVNKDLPASYMRYIERRIREEFDLPATPIKLRVRRRGE